MVNISRWSDFYSPGLSVGFINDAVMMEGLHCVRPTIMVYAGKSATTSYIGGEGESNRNGKTLIRGTAWKRNLTDTAIEFSLRHR